VETLILRIVLGEESVYSAGMWERGAGMKAYCQLLICVTVLLSISASASTQEDAAADAVAAAFINARSAAQLPKLERMGKNTFREKVCKHDMRFSSGLIETSLYETSDPGQLSGSAQKMAVAQWPGRTAARFGIGVCLTGSTSGGKPTYSVLIATYESR
jgi:hypothetical protein